MRSVACGRNRPAVHAEQFGRLTREGFCGARAARAAAGLPHPVQGRCRRQRPATDEATATSCFGTFTICCSTRAARRVGAPTRWARFSLCGVIAPLPAVRPRWPGKRIDLRKFSAAHSRPRAWPPPESARDGSQICCASVIRPAASTTSDRSRLPSFHVFSTAPRAFWRRQTVGLMRAEAVRRSSTRPGRTRRRARATSSNYTWRSTDARGSPAGSIITTPATRPGGDRRTERRSSMLVQEAAFAMDAAAVRKS